MKVEQRKLPRESGGFELTPDQVGRFHQDGFLLVERLIADDLVEALRDRFTRLFRGEFETGISPDEVNWQEGESDPSLTRQICNGWRADRTIASVILREDLGRALAALGGWPGTRVMSDNLLWKPRDTRPLGYHQDNAYLRWFEPTELLTCWIALDETTAEGGTLEFVRGSHRWQPAPLEGAFHGPADYRRPMEQAAAREGVAPEVAPVELPMGGASIHHGWTWHGSGHNRGERPRRALVLHGMRSDVRYVPGCLDQGNGRVYGRYKRLGDNELDENYFPVIWRRDGYRTPGIEAHLVS